MPIIIDEVRGEVDPQRPPEPGGNRPPARPSPPPREIEIKESLRVQRMIERRMGRLRAD